MLVNLDGVGITETMKILLLCLGGLVLLVIVAGLALVFCVAWADAKVAQRREENGVEQP